MVETIKNGWSCDILEDQIKYKLYERKAIADKTTNFENTLPDIQSDLAIQTIKDPYVFDFIALKGQVKEKQIEDAMIEKIKNDLNKQSQKLTAYSNVLNDVMNQFVSADSKKKTNIDAVSFEKNTTVVAAGMVGAMLKNTLNGWVSKEQLDKVNKNAGKMLQNCKNHNKIKNDEAVIKDYG